MSSPSPARHGPAEHPIATVLLPFTAAFFLQELYRVAGAVMAPRLVDGFSLDAREIGLLTSIYFLTFAAMQLPSGLLLDRFGPRRVLAALLSIGILGALVFATATGFGALLLGRAMLGLAGSACLMGSFTAAALWFPRERLVLVNGAILALGSLGGLLATVPMEWLLTVVDWRWVWVGTAAMTCVVIVALLRVAPERTASKTGGSGWAGYGAIVRMPLFWRIAPAMTLTQGTWLAYQGLWAGAWLDDVAGLGQQAIAAHLLLMVCAAVPGYLFFGLAAERLQRAGVSARQTFIAGQIAFLAAQALILALPERATWLAWAAFGLLGTAGGLGFPILTQASPQHLAGRANSALNLTLFAGAFALQFGIGWMIAAWPREGSGSYPDGAHWWTLLAQTGLQALALCWFFLAPRALPRS